MCLGTDITQAQHRIVAQLTFDGKEVVLVVRVGIVRIRGGHSGLGKKRREIDIWVGMAHRGIERRKIQRKGLNMSCAVSCRDKWPRKQRRSGTRIAQSVRRLRFVYGDRVALNHRIEYAISCTDARLSRPAEDLAEHPGLCRR